MVCCLSFYKFVECTFITTNGSTIYFDPKPFGGPIIHTEPLLPPNKTFDYLMMMMQEEAFTNTNKPIKSVVILVDFRACGGKGPAMTEKETMSVVYGSNNDSVPTVEELVKGCSHGQARFHVSQKKVATVSMNICSGEGNAEIDSWSYDSCPLSTEFNRVVEKRGQELGMDFAEYDYRWLILDKGQVNKNCFYAGLGTLGCWDETSDRSNPVCRITLSGKRKFSKDPFLWFHEIGHNFGLLHSSTPFSEYGDHTCSMGGFDSFPPSSKCFNLPQAVKLGWSKAQYTINGHNIYNRWKSFTLHAFNVRKRAGLRLKMGKNSLYVTYRIRTGAFKSANGKQLDNGIDPDLHDIQVHRMLPLDSGSPVLMTTMSPGSMYTEPTFNVVVNVAGIAVSSPGLLVAKVSVCRKKRWYHCSRRK